MRNTQELRVEYNVASYCSRRISEFHCREHSRSLLPLYHFKSIRSVFHKHWIHKAQITVNTPFLPVENFGVFLPYMWNVFASSTFFSLVNLCRGEHRTSIALSPRGCISVFPFIVAVQYLVHTVVLCDHSSSDLCIALCFDLKLTDARGHF